MKGMIRMFFQTKKPATPILDTYEQVKTLVTALLHYECPEHLERHHILYTTNQRLEQFRETRNYYRQQIDAATATGTFSRQVYESANQKYNQLYLLIRAYMHLSDEQKRDHFNHHFCFSDTRIDTLFHHYKRHQEYPLAAELVPHFWQALKDDLTPLLTQIE